VLIKVKLTPNRAQIPQTTSLRVLVGAQPVGSRDLLLNILRQTTPLMSMLGCQILVLHLT